MEVEKWKLQSDLCRCCHSEGSFKNLGLSWFNDEGKVEVYSLMLKEHLGITVTPVEGFLSKTTYTICETCVARLQDVTNFKQQVLTCEEKFQEMISKNIFTVEPFPEVKVEIDDNMKVEDDNDGFNDLFSDEEREDEGDIEIEIKRERSTSRAKGKGKSIAKRKLPAPKKKITKKASKPKKVKLEESEEKPATKRDSSDAAANKAEKKKGPRGPIFRLNENVDYTADGNDLICKRCERRYDKMASLRFHVKTNHFKIPRFSCPVCQKAFMTQAPLTIHKLEEHNMDDRFKCNACKGVFNTKVQLRKHINNFHMMGERYKCEFCEYESFSFEGMYKHKFKHKTVKDHHCRFCRKSFLRKTTKDLHERIHTGDRRKVCTVCGQAFVQKASLNYHMAKYHPEVNF